MKPKLPSLRSSILPARIALSIGLSIAWTTQMAQADWTGTTNQDWNTATNWGGTFPTANAIVNTTTGNFPVIAADPAFTPVDIVLGNGGALAGRVDQRAGTVTTGNGNWLTVQSVSSANSFYNFADTSTTGGTLTGYGAGGGSLTVGGTSATSGRITLGSGGSGTGTFNMNTSGTLTTKDSTIGMLLGTNGGKGVFNLDGGTVSTGNVWVADNSSTSTGAINISGGTFNSTVIYLSHPNSTVATGTGSVNVSGGTVNNSGEITLGAYYGGTNSTGITGTGTVTVTGGTLNTGALTLARANKATNGMNGTATISGGVVTSTNDVIVGYAGTGTGTLTISGGTLNVGTTATKWLQVGEFDTVKGLLNVSSGALKLNTNTAIKLNTSSTTGVNVVTQSGGTITFYSDNATTVGGTGNLDMQYSGSAASNNTYHLNGGTLTVPQIVSTKTTGTRTFNFNGGTLKPTASSTAFLNSGVVTVANVRDNGAKIDSNGFDITIGQALTHSAISGDAATDGGLVKSGAGTLTLTGTCTYTGATGINAGTLQIGNGTTDGSVATSSGITDNSALIYNLTGARTYANVIGGTGTLAKSGAGTLTLSGANTYTGTTTVSGGTLAVTGSLASGSAVSVASGAILAGTGTVNGMVTAAAGGVVTGGIGTSGTLTTGNMTFNGAGTVNVGLFSNYGATAAIAAGTLTANGAAGSVTVNVGGASAVPGTYNLMSYTGGAIGGTGTSAFVLGTKPANGPRISSATLVDSGSALQYVVVGDAPYWTGTAGSAWNTTTSNLNWKLIVGLTDTYYIEGDTVTFDDNATNTAVDIAANVSPLAVTFNNSSKDYTITGAAGIAGTTGLAKYGTGKVTITNTNTYTGATTISAGTLQIGDGTTDGSIASSSGITDNATLGYNLAGSRTYANVISGTGMLVKSGAGTLTLSGANTYGGGTTINGGILQLTQTASAAAAGTFNLAGGNLQINQAANNFNYGAALNLTADSTFSNIGAGQINYTGTLTGNSHALNVSTTTPRLYMNGTVSGISQFNVTAGAMGFDLSVGNRGGGAPVVVSSGASLWIANAASTLANNITLNGGTGQGGLGAIYQEGAGTPTLSGTLTLNSGDNSLGGNTAGAVVTLSGKVTGSGALTKIGANIYKLSFANDYAGGTTVTVGTLAVSGTAAANSAALGSGAVTVNTGAQLRLGMGPSSNTNVATISNNITLAGGAIYEDDAFQHLSGTLSVTAAGTLGSTYNAGSNAAGEQNKGLFLDCVVSGSANLAVQHSGLDATHTYSTSIVYFTNNANTYSGTVTVNPMTGTAGGSYLGINGSTALRYATVNLNGNNTSTNQNFGTSPVVFNTGLGTATLGALAGSGNVVLTGYNESTHAYGADPIALTAGGNGGGTTYSGVISGAGSLTKTGAGMMTLTGANTYTGATTINTGTLDVSNPLALQNSTLTMAGGGVVFDSAVTGNAFTVGGLAAASGGAGYDIALQNNASTPAAVALTVGNTNSLTSSYAGVLSGAGSLTKAGTGTLTLSDTNTYTGTTTVNGGTLAVTGSLASGGAVTVGGSTATGTPVLTGTGTVGGTVTIAAAGTGVAGKINPGGVGTVGTLSTGSATIAGTYTCDISGATADKLVVTGNLDLSAASLEINGTPTATSYVIATYTGTETGASFVSVSPALPSGYAVRVDTANKQVLIRKSGYDSWMETYYPGLSDKTPGGDPDHDGISNLMEYVLNGNPGESSMSSLPSLTPDSGNLIFTFTRTVASANDTTQVFEYGTDLSGWTPLAIPADSGTYANVVVGTAVASPTGDVQVVTITIPKGTNAELFGRLHVTQP